MTTNNVIQFLRNANEFPLTAQESNERILQVRGEYANEILEDLIQKFAHDLDMYGCNTQKNEQSQKDFLFLCEALNACISRHIKISHPFHEMIEDMMFIGTKEEFDAKVAAMEADESAKKKPRKNKKESIDKSLI